MTLPHLIELDSLQIVGGHGTDGIYFSGLSGWYDLADGRGSLDVVPAAHGSYARTRVWRDSKAPTISGVVQAPDRARAEELMMLLKRVAADATVLAVTDETGRWSSTVEVEAVDFDDRGAWSAYVPFTIDLIAPDPVRYSELLTVGPVGLPVQSGGLFLPAALPWDLGVSDLQVAEVENFGELPILPTVTITGSADSVVMHGGPRRLSFGSFDGVLKFDALDRRAWLNGTEVTRSLIRRDWPIVPAGVTHGFFFEAVNPSSDINLLVEYRIGVW